MKPQTPARLTGSASISFQNPVLSEADYLPKPKRRRTERLPYIIFIAAAGGGKAE